MIFKAIAFQKKGDGFYFIFAVMKIIRLLVVMTILGGTEYSIAQSNDDTIKLKAGDLLFQEGNCGEFCQAIRAVTQGVHGHDFSHVGIVYPGKGGELFVLEAVSEGVILTPADQFLQRDLKENGAPDVVIGRLKKQFQHLITPALKAGTKYLQKPYDVVFDIDNDSYYCSELIYYMFLEANQGRPVFELQPMTFEDPATGETFPVWVDYYAELGKEIPEGEPGLNPGSISRSEKLEIIYFNVLAEAALVD